MAGSPSEFRIGHPYGLVRDTRYFRVTLMSVDASVQPPRAHVIIQEHSVESFIEGTGTRKRHKYRGDPVPCANVPLTDLIDIG